MKIPKSSFSEYFKRSVVFLIKTKLAVFLTSIIEFIDLCTNVVDITNQIFFYGKEYNYKNSNLSKIILAASPYQYFFNFITSDKTESFFTRNILFIIIYAVLFIWFLIYFLSIRNGDLDAMPACRLSFRHYCRHRLRRRYLVRRFLRIACKAGQSFGRGYNGACRRRVRRLLRHHAGILRLTVGARRQKQRKYKRRRKDGQRPPDIIPAGISAHPHFISCKNLPYASSHIPASPLG